MATPAANAIGVTQPTRLACERGIWLMRAFALLQSSEYHSFMSDTVVHAESYGSLLFAPQTPCFIISWHGFANSAQFRFLMNQGLEPEARNWLKAAIG